MKQAVVVVLAYTLLAGTAVTAQELEPPALSVPTMTVEEVRPGMKGIALTVFEGVKPEPMDLVVLGVLRNAAGPKGDIVLVRLVGSKPEHTGVVAGMSGSPVYINGKLLGALAFRIGQFSKEPIAGVTPIGDMLEINTIDKAVPAAAQTTVPRPRQEVSRTSAGLAESIEGFAQYLQPIEAPLVFSGFSQEAVRQFAPEFAKYGILPVMGIGSSTEESQPEPIEPGSAVSAVLVRGDMNLASTCTVTYIDPERLLACGHPILNFGQVDIPMTKARVVATLASPLNAFKIVNTTEPVGAFVQDRHSGILGRFGQSARMIPVTINLRSGERKKQLNFEVLNNAKLTPVAMMTTVFNSLQGMNEYGEDVSFRMQGKISVNGFPDVGLKNMYAPVDPSVPTGVAVALSIGERFSRIFDNPNATPRIQGVNLDFEVLPERRWARLESVRTDVTEARPGDEIRVEAAVKPYRGERIVRQIPVRIPTSTPKGLLRILVSDGDTLDRARRVSPAMNRKLDIGSTIAVLNKEHVNDHLYVSLLEANPQAMVEDKVMPGLPVSVMNVMEGMRGTQDMVVTGESAVNEAATPLDYVVSGAQLITITIK